MAGFSLFFCDLERCSIQPVRTQVPQLRAGACAE
jgi:hypothetical protein